MGKFSILTSLTLNSAGFNKGLDEANSKVKNFGKNAKSAFSGIEGLLPTIGIGLLVDKMISFGTESYQAYEEQEKANRRLKTALNGNVEAYNRLTKASSKLQAETGIDEEAISQIQLLGISAGFSSERVDKLVQASVALSSLTGKDLQASYLQLSKSLDGTAGKLGAVDAEILTLSKDQLKNGDAIDLMIQKHGDLAKESATTSEKVSKNWGEIKESVGGNIAKFINPALEDLNNHLMYLNEQDMSGFEKFMNLLIWQQSPQEKMALEQKKLNEEIDKGAKGVVSYIKTIGGYDYLLKGIQTIQKEKGEPKPPKKDVQKNVKKEIDYSVSEVTNYEFGLSEYKVMIAEEARLRQENEDAEIESLNTIDESYTKTYENMTKSIIDEDLKKQNIQLERTKQLADLAGSAIDGLGNAFIQMAETGEVSFKGFVMSMLDGVRSIINSLLVQALAGQLAANSRFGLPGLALAAVGMIAVEALFASLPKFATGGIIGGNSYTGDMLTARVNSGEMILNQSQQSKLFNMANSGGLGGQVEFKIRGTELVGVINNYSKKRSNTI